MRCGTRDMVVRGEGVDGLKEMKGCQRLKTGSLVLLYYKVFVDLQGKIKYLFSVLSLKMRDKVYLL